MDNRDETPGTHPCPQPITPRPSRRRHPPKAHRWIEAKGKATSSGLLAATAGLGFGMVGVAARILIVPDPWWHTLAQPALWAIAAHGIIGTVAYAYALERGRTTSVAAITFSVETVVPALIGLRFLGDGVRPHLGTLAILGFVLTLGACIVLASRAEPDLPT